MGSTFYPGVDFVVKEGHPGDGFLLAWFPTVRFPDQASIYQRFSGETWSTAGFRGFAFCNPLICTCSLVSGVDESDNFWDVRIYEISELPDEF